MNSLLVKPSENVTFGLRKPSTMNKPKDPRPWKVLKIEYLVRRPWLTARKDCVELPNGTVNDEFYVMEYPDWVNVIARTTDGSYVLIRQYRHGLGRTCYEIVAGVIDPTDASPEAATRRELLEETGYSGGTWRLLTTLSCNPSAMNNLVYCFVAEGVERTSTQHLEATEDITVHLFDEAEVSRLLENDDIVQALMAAPLWKYLSLKEKGG